MQKLYIDMQSCPSPPRACGARYRNAIVTSLNSPYARRARWNLWAVSVSAYTAWHDIPPKNALNFVDLIGNSRRERPQRHPIERARTTNTIGSSVQDDDASGHCRQVNRGVATRESQGALPGSGAT